MLSRITNDVDTLSNALQQTLSRVISAVCTFVFVLFMMFRIHAIMALIIVCILPIIYFLSRFIVKKSQPLFDEQQAKLADLNGTVNELYDGYQEIMMYNQQRSSLDKFKEVNEGMRVAGFKAQFVSSLISPLSSLITYLTIGVVALYGCFLVLSSNNIPRTITSVYSIYLANQRSDFAGITIISTGSIFFFCNVKVV